MIKNLREKAGYTQTELAKMMGLRQSTIAMWETGRTKPKVDNLIKLCKILNCSIEKILKE